MRVLVEMLGAGESGQVLVEDRSIFTSVLMIQDH